jgi:hypothetical protein
MWTIKWSTLLVPITALLLIAAACSSQKNLTPSIAGAMLQKRIDANQEITVPYSDVAALIREKTFQDYNQGNYTAGSAESRLQHLLRANLAEQSVETHSYANLTGTYQSGDPLAPLTLTLSMQQGSLAVTGTFRTASDCSGTLFGKVNVDGTVNLFFTLQGGVYCSSIHNNNLTIDIRQSGDFTELSSRPAAYTYTLNVRGKSSSDQIKIPVYTYTLSPKFLAMVPTPGITAVKAGPVQVDSVDNLLLGPTETMAEGRFKWHMDFNPVARVLTGKPGQSGYGSIEFGKQPDGNWVVRGFSL